MKFKRDGFMYFFTEIGWKWMLMALVALSIVVGSYAFIIWLAKIIWNS